MKKICLLLLTALLSVTADAETFEEAISRQPPETDKSFLGITDMVLDKTNDALANANEMLKGISSVLESVAKGDSDKMSDGVNSVLSGINGVGATFIKQTEAHRVKLEEQVKAEQAKLDAAVASGASGKELALAWLSLGNAQSELAAYAAAHKAYANALVAIASCGPDHIGMPEYSDILLASFNCAFDSYRTDIMQTTLRAMKSAMASGNTDAGALQSMQYLLSDARFNIRTGNRLAANADLTEALKLFIDHEGDKTPLANISLEATLELMANANALGHYKSCTDTFEGIASDGNIDGLPATYLARFLLTGSEAYARTGEIRRAYDLLSKAGQIIQKEWPEGSLHEFDYLILAGELNRINATLPNEKQVTNRYTSAGLLYHLNGCRLLASRIWGDGIKDINPMLRKINRKLALSAVLDSRLHSRAAQSYPSPSVLKIAAVLAGNEKYSADEQKHIDHDSRAGSSRNLAKKLYILELATMRSSLHSDFLTMTDARRADYMEAAGELVNDIYNFGDTDDSGATAEMVYDACLLSKSMLLAFSRSIGNVVRTEGDASLNEEYSALMSLRQKIIRAEQSSDFTEVSKLRAEADEKERVILCGIAEITDPGAFMSTTWNDVKSSLPPKSVAVEFYTFTDNLFGDKTERERMVVLSSKKKPDIFILNYAPGEIKTAEKWRRDGLYSQIWEPLAKKKFIKPGCQIFFSPAGRWNNVALEYLPDGDKKTMNETYDMVRVSTTRQLPATSERPSLATATIFGGLTYSMDISEMTEIRDELASGWRSADENSLWNLLPASGEEASGISDILSGANVACTLISGCDGIEESFKALSGTKSDIIHVATHGYRRPVEEACFLSAADRTAQALNNAGLVFSGANNFITSDRTASNLDDGYLTAREISLMDLSQTDMVVLSACDTGTGLSTTEGVIGLQRGFKLAGAKTIVMSLWKVNDAAASTMMTSFYNYLAQGQSKRAAFYSARNDMRNGIYQDENGNQIKGTDPFIADAFIIMD